MAIIKNSNTLRMIILGGLLIFFLIPIFIVEDLVRERSNRSVEARNEISSKWGGDAKIIGPMLVVPYTTIRREQSAQNPNQSVSIQETRYAYFLPEYLSVGSNLKSETRKRGIYSAVLFNSDSQIVGSFKNLDPKKFSKSVTSVQWDDSFLILSIQDTQGIGQQAELTWNNKKYSWEPGTKYRVFPSGIHANFSRRDLNMGQDNEFKIAIKLKGSGSILFAPVGKSTEISVQSDWGDPSFIGSILPESREINSEGFQATWNSSYYARNYPEFLETMDNGILNAVHDSAFGVNFFQQIDSYKLVLRSVKYAILIILASFTIYFLLEIFSKKKLHPIQYALIGSAMVVFYVLTLSLSEHIGFDISYVIASFATSSLIGYYTANILGESKRGIGSATYFLLLYGFIYIILSAEDYALLLGSFAIFLLLAAVMFLTRKMDWYEEKAVD